MDQGEAGKYRMIAVRVGQYRPPPRRCRFGADVRVAGMVERRLPKNSRRFSVRPFCITASRPSIHLPTATAARAGRSRCGSFTGAASTRITFSRWMNITGKIGPKYYAELDGVRQAGEDLTAWLEYCAAGLRQTLERAWLRIQTLQVKSYEEIGLAAAAGTTSAPAARSRQHGSR